jgi:hypothetical protein
VASIFSQQLVNASFTTPFGAPIYTVPAGFLVVVTDVISAGGGSDPAQYLLVEIGVVPIINDVMGAAGFAMSHWAGKEVLNAGDSLVMYSDADSFANVGATGYVLPIF